MAELLANSEEITGGLARAYSHATGEVLEENELEAYAERLASGSTTLAELLPEIGALRLVPPALPDDDDGDAIAPIPPSSPAMTFLVPADSDTLLAATPGADLFVFIAGPGDTSVISGFNPAMDVLQFDSSTFADRAAFDASLANTPDGVQLYLPFGGSLLLVGLNANDLLATAVALS